MNELLANMDVVALGTQFGTAHATATESVNMKNYDQIVALVTITDTGTATDVTMKQGSTSTASTALGFTKYFYKADIATSNAWVEGTASSNTFATGTSSKTGVYAIPVTADMLDKTAEGEDTYLRCNCATASGAKIALQYLCFKPRYASGVTGMPSVA
jgi:hypothetical protein